MSEYHPPRIPSKKWRELAGVETALDPPGASERAAEFVLEELRGRSFTPG
jgi:hypothetical protein